MGSLSVLISVGALISVASWEEFWVVSLLCGLVCRGSGSDLSAVQLKPKPKFSSLHHCQSLSPFHRPPTTDHRLVYLFSPELQSPEGYHLKAAGLVIEVHRFSSEDVSAQNQVKASVQRRIRQSIAEEYPGLEPVLDDLLPKKSPLIVTKCQNHLNLVVVNNVPLFFNIRDGPYMPTLRLLHQYPNIMKKLQVDRGAIKFVLAGANIMCPGLTSPGGVLDEEVGSETPVAIMAEGKQHALAIGFTKMSAKDIKAINKGIGVDNMHYLNDGLWKMEHFS
ncbi:hypothetical protein F8388_000027 [Cannabis sativa]|uniref:PUA domain-containing protein n=1 Tax=Cannabis sativa TaxID=3483 RepID=A0A7J6GUK2_CANSA|nr:hypothetical protein F8388_000027 [Cannabis sativa]KAF4386030.1 hypothetical protein G4B88_031165 [Cannabis sativa]